MSLKEQIQKDQIQAMKQKEERRLAVLRMVWAAVRNTEIDVQHELADQEVQDVVRRQVKQLQDALTDFTSAGRSDLITQTQEEIGILEQYLPAQLSEEALRTLIEPVVSAAKAGGSANIGQVIGQSMKVVAGRADGNRVRDMVTTLMK